MTDVDTAAANSGSFMSLLSQGGIVLYILVLVSIVALTIIIAKSIQFAMARIGARDFVEGVVNQWREGHIEEARVVLTGAPGPLARVLSVALAVLSNGRLGEDKAREEVARFAGEQIDRLRTGLPTLALIAALSPLLGLLGTVIGMIGAFQALEAAGNRVNPSILSGGIWVALLTTAAGLIIAIPALTAHHWLDGRFERCARSMEDAVTRLFTSTNSPGSRTDNQGRPAE